MTIYGDAILPRGGAWTLADLLVLLRRLGIADGVARTAMSRLAREGVLTGQRFGRQSAYFLTDAGRAEFGAAVPRIYGGMHAAWDGHLALAFPDVGADRTPLEHAGFALLAPGVLIGPSDATDGDHVLQARGPDDLMRSLARRAWPLDRLAERYLSFADTFTRLAYGTPPSPLDAMAARIALIHSWRRIALQDPRLPAALLAPDWPGDIGHDLCRTLYERYAAASELWLDTTTAGPAPLLRGADPARRFSGGGRPPAAPASSPEPAGTRRPPRSTTT